MSARIPRDEWLLVTLITALLLFAAAWRWLGATEVFGFVTGGVCVWLLVRQHLLNWPIGLLNNIVFFVLFYEKRLFADMGLQVIFFVLGVYGWWHWARRGTAEAPLRPTHAARWEWFVVPVFVVLATLGLRELLLSLNGAAPVGDAVTTALSLGAQYLICRKRIENWYLWILADIIYVPLYLSRDLPLTAVLYAGFLALSVLGLRAWRRSMREASSEATS
jgi:nicotinamide mononucleotide transporter